MWPFNDIVNRTAQIKREAKDGVEHQPGSRKSPRIEENSVYSGKFSNADEDDQPH